MPDISLLLVDDHGLVRRGFRRLLEDEPLVGAVHEASDGPEAIEIAKRMHPDVVLLDYKLPSMSGAIATKRILAAVPSTAVLIVSMYSEPSCVQAALDAGAAGYLLKSATDFDLVSAVRRIVAGERPVLDSRVELATDSLATKLSSREREVLQLILHGKSNREIGIELGISANTVSVHRGHIMKVLGTHKTSRLVVYAIRNGLMRLV